VRPPGAQTARKSCVEIWAPAVDEFIDEGAHFRFEAAHRLCF